jgi:hypothetical protein
MGSWTTRAEGFRMVRSYKVDTGWAEPRVVVDEDVTV